MSFTRVSKSHPCPVCKRPDWCRVFADGWAECMRVQSDKPAKSGGWLHWLDSSLSASTGERAGVRCRTHLSPPPSINATKLMRGWWTSTAEAKREAFARELGLSAASLVAVGAAWAAPHNAWAFPMCDGYGNVVGIRLRNERGKFAVRGSRQGIFTTTDHGPQTNEGQRPAIGGQRPEARKQKGETLFVCEGPTDTAAAVQLGLFAVGRSNCCCGGAEIRTYARRHDVSRVVIISDNDKPGLDGARKVGSELKLPFAIYVPPAKDLREFVRLGGTRAMIENTLNNTVWNT